jgi:A/G-specific adenine glycosylase
VAYVMTHARRVAMIQRPTRGLLGGMLGLPTSEWREGSWNMNEAVAAAPMALNWCVAGTVHHMFTHFSLTLDVLSGGATTADPSFLWMLQGEARSAAPTVFRKAIALGL